MMFKNTVKLLFANFSLVWKILLYYIIISLIGVGLIAPCFSSISVVFREHEFFEMVIDLLSTFNLGTNIISVFAGIGNLFAALGECIIDYFALHTWLAVYLTFLFVILLPFLYGLGGIAVGESLYGYMSSQTKVSFAGRIFSSLRKSFKFLISKIIVTAPVNITIFYAVLKSFELTTLSGTIRFAVPLIIAMIICILLTLRIILFSGWLPAFIVNDCGVFRSFGRGIVAVGRKFFRGLSNLFVIILLSLCFAILFGSIALLLIIPICFILIYIFSFVLFYESQGMRYYVDMDTIISPKRLEEVDKFNNCKDLI